MHPASLLIPASAVHSIPPLPESLEPYLMLLEDPAGLPICRSCQAAILPKSLGDHFRKIHQLPVELRSVLKSLTATLPSLEFDHVPQKPDGSTPLEALRVVDAFQCKHCPFIRRDLTDVRKHINQEHGLSAAGSYDQIQAQSWFGGRRAVYWKVCTAMEKPLRGETPPCLWGFYGKGFGHRRPIAWEKDKVAESLISDPQQGIKE